MHAPTLSALLLIACFSLGQGYRLEDDGAALSSIIPSTWVTQDTAESTWVTEDTTTPATNPCPDPYQRVGDYCFHFQREFPQDWSFARQYCAGIGGDLAVPHSCELFGQLVEYIHSSGQEVPEAYSYWVGGTDGGEEGEWYWVDGVRMAMGVPFWGSEHNMAEPSGGEIQNCAHLDSSDRYYIHDGECNLGAFPLCQYDVDSKL